MSRAIVKQLLDRNFRIVTWPAVGDKKGPSEEGWTKKIYTLDDYKNGNRVGIVLGHEIEPGRILHDIDLDWAEGAEIALKIILPVCETQFVYGRASKPISHLFYTTPEGIPKFAYTDIDGTTLIELRGTTADGEIGHQSMAPPSIWAKDGKVEPLEFKAFREVGHIEDSTILRQIVCKSAIAMLFARHLGQGGFGHQTRLAWAGYLLRAGMKIEELIPMGQAIGQFCGSRDVGDIAQVLESTKKALDAKGGRKPTKKVAGSGALIQILGQNGKAIINKINEWIGNDSDFIRNDNGAIIKDSQENIKRAVRLIGLDMSYNQFSGSLMVNKERPLEDEELTRTWLQVEREFRFRPSFEYFEKVLKSMGWENPYHPVKDYLVGLEWDGTERLDRWLIEAGEAEDTPYVRSISAILMIAAVRRIMYPGCTYQELVVLEGSQGTLKSSALRVLCPNSDWFSDDVPLNVHAKELIERTSGKWIIEASELSGMRASLIEQLKSMLSRPVDGPARLAYARLPVERARQFVMVGTTNSKVYLADSTGGRRFWPIEVKRFNLQWIIDNRDQLWAEAVRREGAGESIRMDESLWEYAAEKQEQRREMDPWEPIILTSIIENKDFHSEDGRIRVPTDLIWGALGADALKRDRKGQLRISDIMQRLGFERSRVRNKQTKSIEVGYVSTDANWLTHHHREDLQSVLNQTDHVEGLEF